MDDLVSRKGEKNPVVFTSFDRDVFYLEIIIKLLRIIRIISVTDILYWDVGFRFFVVKGKINKYSYY